MKRKKNSFKERSFKEKILIFCEGLTEKNYLNAFKEDLNLSKTISVNVFHSSKSDCNGIIKEALGKAKKESFDKVYVVFDHDNQAKRSDAFQLAESNGVFVIFSSICFEVWFLMHFTSSARSFMSETELEKELKKCQGMERYQKGDFRHYSILKDKLGVAKSNAAKMRDSVIRNNQEKEIFDLNPYTNIDELILLMEAQK